MIKQTSAYKKNNSIFHLYVESKTDSLIETESRTVITRVQEGEKWDVGRKDEVYLRGRVCF